MGIDKKVVIIGGGPAGCAAAAYALKNGFQKVTLLESAETLGGFHKDVEINGLHFDLGAFFFWSHHQLLTLFPGLRERLVYAESSRHLSLSNNFNLDKYPITFQGYVKDHGLISAGYDLAKIAWARIKGSEAECRNVEQLLLFFMGPFYRKTGLDHYVRRLFHLDPQDIHVEFAYKRLGGVIEKFRSRNVLRNMLKGNIHYFTTYNIMRDIWARPESGFGEMYDYINKAIAIAGGAVRCNSPVERINCNEKSIQIKGGEILEYDYLLSSQPLHATSKMTGIDANVSLDYQPLCSLFYEAKCEVLPECFVLFNFTNKGKWKRITFHSNYYNIGKDRSLKRRFYFVVESLPHRNQLSNPALATELDDDFKETFYNTKWNDLFRDVLLVGHRVTENAYPVFGKSFDREKVIAFNDRLARQHVYGIGRQGEFDHVSSSDASKSALNAIDAILLAEKTARNGAGLADLSQK